MNKICVFNTGYFCDFLPLSRLPAGQAGQERDRPRHSQVQAQAIPAH